MKVIQIVPGILEQASGTSYSVPALCGVLSNQGMDLELHVNSGNKPLEVSYPFHSHGCWKWPPRLDISPQMRKALKKAASCADIVHNHGLWNMANIYAGRAARDEHCKLIISPRGTLNSNALKKSRWKKKIIWLLRQRRMLKNAVCFHATSPEEYKAIRNAGFEAPIAIIPNGIDIPDLSEASPGETPPRRMRRLLFLSRITPVKCIDHLLEAWSVVHNDFTEWELHVTGVDDRGHEGRMKALAQRLEVKRVSFTGPVYGADKSRAFLEADLFVLPSCTENFGMAVAEALAHGVPTIVAKGAPWQGLETRDCGWWIDIGVKPLIECLCFALTESPEILREKGTRGREWMKLDFCWSGIGEKMRKTYEWIFKDGDVPGWVRLD